MIGTIWRPLGAFAAVLLLASPVVLRAAGQNVPTPGKGSFDVRSFGATGDGRTLNTAAIQKAIDACQAAA